MIALAPVQVVPTGVEQTPRFPLMVVEPVFVTVELPRTAKFPRAGMLFSPTGPAWAVSTRRGRTKRQKQRLSNRIMMFFPRLMISVKERTHMATS